MEKFPNIDKVNGSVPLNKVEKRLEDYKKDAREDFKDFEIMPTDEEEQIIDDVSYGLKVMLEHVYKIPCKQISKEKIHIVREGTLIEKYGRGMHQSPIGEIYLEPLASSGSKIVFAKVLAHELIHYLSFCAIKVSEKNGKVSASPHIDGLGILKYEEDGVREYFNVVDEAATSYISNKFLNLELDRLRNNLGEKMIYTDECLALDTVREWLHGLPDSVGIDRYEWDKYYIVSIPFADEMAKLIKGDASDEEKINFYKEKIANLPKKQKFEFYLERTREIEEVYKEISAMFSLEESDPAAVKQKTIDFVEKIALLKLTGKGFFDLVRFIEKKLGPGSFKKLAEKFGRFEIRQ